MRALIIGDSHVDHSTLAKQLTKELKALGYDDVTAAGVGATAATTWLNNDKVCRPKKDYCVDKTTLPKNPDLLIISLGTNDSGNAAAGGGDLAAKADKNVERIKQIIEYFAPVKTLWVGPPWMGDKLKWYTNANMAHIYDAAARAGVPIFDSRVATRPLVEAGSGDGVHLGSKGSQAWAKAIAVELGAPPQTQQPQQAGVSPLLLGVLVLGVLLLLRRKA